MRMHGLFTIWLQWLLAAEHIARAEIDLADVVEGVLVTEPNARDARVIQRVGGFVHVLRPVVRQCAKRDGGNVLVLERRRIGVSRSRKRDPLYRNAKFRAEVFSGLDHRRRRSILKDKRIA